MPSSRFPALIVWVFLSGICMVPPSFSGTNVAQRNGVAVPLGTWTQVFTRGLPESSNDWEQLIYVHAIEQSVMLSQYHQTNSEPNESLLGYNFDTNSWDVLDMGGLFHTENMPEGGESLGYFDVNPNNSTIIYHCCVSGSNQPENINHTWWFDVLGQSGRDKFTSPEPPFLALQPGGAFDVAHNLFVVQGGASFVGTWTYDPEANSWRQMTTAGPDPSIILPGVAYSHQAQQIFLFGGRDGATYYSDLWTYNVLTNTWTKISPVGGVSPPARYRMNFAYDSTNNIFLLYGGQNGSTVLNDTWVYDPDANKWTKLNPPQSPTIGTTSDFSRLAYDSDHNVFVLAHRGSNGYFGGSWKTLPIQTWLFRYAGSGPNAGTVLSMVQSPPGGLNRNPSGWAKDPALAASGDSLFAAWSETGSPFDPTTGQLPHIFASQYSASWTNLGLSYGSISGGTVEAHAPSAAIINGTPWLSWYQANSPTESTSQVWVASWNGTVWQREPIGLVTSSSSQGRSQLTGLGVTPYAAFIEVSKNTYPQSAYVFVKHWNGSSWILQGTGALNHTLAAGTTAASVSIASGGNRPYVAWTEYLRRNDAQGRDVATVPQVYVSYWNGSAWVQLGAALNVTSTDWASDASIAFFNGRPYVAWTERSQTGNAQLYVATWNGSTWISGPTLNLGGANTWAYHPNLVADPIGKNLFAGWVEQPALGNKAQVFVSQLVNGVWTVLGSPLNVNPIRGSAERVSLGVFNGQPVACWSEIELGGLRQVYVSQWNGSAWNQLPGLGAPDSVAPTTPTKLLATVASSTQINLSWAASTDLVGVYAYNVYRNGSPVASVTSATNYQDTGLSPSTTYTYTVNAVDAAGNVSKMSTPVSAITRGVAANRIISIAAPAGAIQLSGSRN